MKKLKIVFWWGMSFNILGSIFRIVARSIEDVGKWKTWFNEVGNHFLFVGFPIVLAVLYLQSEFKKEVDNNE